MIDHLTAANMRFLTVNLYWCWTSCLQCFDAVGWVAGRASGL